MFNKQPPEKQRIDHAIDATFDAYNPNDDDAKKQLKLLKGLHDIKAETKPDAVSTDTKWMVIGNLIGILFIVGHERAHVVRSAATEYVKRIR